MNNASDIRKEAAPAGVYRERVPEPRKARIAAQARTSWKTDLVSHWRYYSAAMLVGALLTAGYILAGPRIMEAASHVDILETMFRRVGVVGILLYPLALLLAYLVIRDIRHLRGACDTPAWSALYTVILCTAPNAGLLGTFIAMQDTFTSIDFSAGLVKAFSGMALQIGVALGSTIFGIILFIVATIAKLLLNSACNPKERQS